MFCACKDKIEMREEISFNRNHEGSTGSSWCHFHGFDRLVPSILLDVSGYVRNSRGKEIIKTDTVNIPFKYCPFCGKEYQKPDEGLL